MGSNAFERFLGRSREQFAGLVVGECRRLALVGLALRALYAFDRIVGDGVLVAEILKKRRQRREAMPDRRSVQCPLSELIAPCDHVGWSNNPEFLWSLDTYEQHEVPNGVLIGSFRVQVADILKPLRFGRHVGQTLEVGRRQEPRFADLLYG